MIYGIGTDICAIDRVADILSKKHANRFVSRILTVEEIERFESLTDKRKIEFLTGRFALKEAISKAFGTGIGKTIGFHDMTIYNNSQGKPCCRLSDLSYKKLSLLESDTRVHCSISHEKHYALAYVIVEQK